MSPGPELDVLVAIKVMGLSPWPGRPDAVRASLTQFKPCLPPEYSTDIAAAWRVVEKFDYLYLFRAPEISDGMYECKLTMADDRKYYALSETAPHAICLAALRAVGVEI